MNKKRIGVGDFRIDKEERVARCLQSILNLDYPKKKIEIAAKHNLKLIYDAAHCFGIRYKGQSVLKYGDASILSFHATKIFHTVEGGAIVVRDKRIFEKLKLLRNFGIKSEEEIILPGINAKMNELQAAMGLCNLKTINEEIRLRKKIYEHDKQILGNFKNITLQKIISSQYNYSYMPVCFKNSNKRNEIYFELIRNGVKSQKYFFPLTINFKYFKRTGVDLVEKYGLKTAADIADRVLCLPIYSDLDMTIVDKIIKIIKQKI